MSEDKRPLMHHELAELRVTNDQIGLDASVILHTDGTVLAADRLEGWPAQVVRKGDSITFGDATFIVEQVRHE